LPPLTLVWLYKAEQNIDKNIYWLRYDALNNCMIEGKISVTWDKNDYESLEYQTHPNIRRGYSSTASESPHLDITHDICYKIPNSISSCLDTFNLRSVSCQIQRYSPGTYLPFHKDAYLTYKKFNNVGKNDRIVRIILFLHDSLPGQQLWIDDQICYGKAGNFYGWKDDCLHMAANLSESYRYNLQITGIESKQ